MNFSKSPVKILGTDERDVISEIQLFREHSELTERLKKTLYYGKLPSTDRPSLPLTGITLEFFSKAVPKESLDVLDIHYAASVSRRACITPCSMMLALVYLEQLRHQNPEYLQTVSSCDIFLVSMLVASKFLYDDGEDDEVFSNEWAASANMELHDLNKLERDFLSAIDWELFVKPEVFLSLLQQIEARIAFDEGSKRGWLSYTDASALIHRLKLAHCWSLLVDGVIKVIVASTLTYMAAVFTLVGAAALVQGWMPHASQLLLRSMYSTSSSVPTPRTSVNRNLLPESNHTGPVVSSTDLTVDIPLSDIATVTTEVNLSTVLSVNMDVLQDSSTKDHTSNFSGLASYLHIQKTLPYLPAPYQSDHSYSSLHCSSWCHLCGYHEMLSATSRLRNCLGVLSCNYDTHHFNGRYQCDENLWQYNTMSEAYRISPALLPPCLGIASKV